jgi:hypothetical protein
MSIFIFRLYLTLTVKLFVTVPVLNIFRFMTLQESYLLIYDFLRITNFLHLEISLIEFQLFEMDFLKQCAKSQK